MRRLLTICMLLVPVLLVGATAASAQVTTASTTGVVTDANGRPLAGAQVVALHEPSGTRYGGITRSDGRFTIPGMRVGGPYRVSAQMIGYATQAREGVQLNLGVATDLAFSLRESAVALDGITVTAAQADATFSPNRTGAATQVERQALEVLPTISGRLESVTRLTPQSGGGLSFAGQDPRLNNIQVDGAYFRNSFGLGTSPGDRTQVAPISLDAIEQVQVNVAPFDVRQGNFVGAAVNSVTRSGTNEVRGQFRYDMRNQDLVGTQAGASTFDPGVFDFRQLGGWVSGPIIRNRLFFFVNLEDERLTDPGTTWRANRGGETAGQNNVTRVLESDLTQLSNFLRTNFDYETGPFQGYDHETPGFRFLGKLDFNLNERNRFSLRYNHLDSSTDVLLSNSASLGFGNRRGNQQGLNFQNSNYQILENRRGLVGEWNAVVGTNMANQMIIGYDNSDESRNSRGTFFPLVDILEGGSVYTSFGFEPFTPSNELRYGSWQFQNNFTRFGTRHTQTFGVSVERYDSENVFFPGSQSVYTYNSLADFYRDANDFLANPNRTASPVALRRFQVRWSNIPGQDKPVQPLEVTYAGVYGQNEWQVSDNLRTTFGLRLDVPFFGETGFRNAAVENMTFRDETGAAAQFRTDKLPDANPLFSPRIGFNWDARGNRTTQIRSGTGIFSGSPAFVWISNQIGENGILTGFEQLDNVPAGRAITAGGRPFNPDPNRYKPAQVSGTPAASYGLAFTDPSFRFPQVWRNNIAIDQRLPFGVNATLEGLYGRDVNGIYYINANLAPSNAQFTGPDSRPRWTGSNRIVSNVTSAIVMKNQNIGRSWHLSGALERPFGAGFYAKAAYAYGESRNTVDPGSIAFGSWNGNPHAGDPNNPGLGFSTNSPGHRIFSFLSYRREYFRAGATTLSVFAERSTPGNASYVFSGDLNGDGGTGNDLLYIHRDVSEMNFQQYTVGTGAAARTFTAQQQAEAWNRFIEQDPYLSRNRGGYAERNAAFLPMRNRVDLTLTQELFTNIAGRRNGLQLRADVLNVANLLNSDWGVGRRFVTTSPLIVPTAAQGGAVDAQGRTQYRMRAINNELVTSSFEPTSGFGDVYRVQFSLRYSFN